MSINRNIRFSGPRVYLRPLVEDDATQIARSAIVETETQFNERGRVPTSELAYREWIRNIGSRPDNTEVTFAICRAGDDADTCIGMTTLRHIDHMNGTAETGTGLFRPAGRGQGFGTEAKNLLLSYAFETLHLHVVTAEVFSANTRSAAALRKQGYRLAGRRAAQNHRAGRFLDGLLFDITREDWLALHSPVSD